MPQKTRDVISRLEKEGWVGRKGKGDHMVFKHPDKQLNISIDTGKREIPEGTYRNKIAGPAGWK